MGLPEIAPFDLLKELLGLKAFQVDALVLQAIQQSFHLPCIALPLPTMVVTCMASWILL